MGSVISSLATVQSTEDGTIQVDLGGKDIVAAVQCAPPGIDAPPLPDDKAVAVEYSKSGENAAVATVVADQAASPGELRLYSRFTDRSVVAVLWLHDDGTIAIETVDGSKIEITSDGISLVGDVSVTGALSVSGAIEGASVTDTNLGVGLGSHVHTSALPGAPTSGPTPGT